MKKLVYRVQIGAYEVKANAEKMAEKLKAAGFDAIIVPATVTLPDKEVSGYKQQGRT